MLSTQPKPFVNPPKVVKLGFRFDKSRLQSDFLDFQAESGHFCKVYIFSFICGDIWHINFSRGYILYLKYLCELFFVVPHNLGVVITIWAPIVLVRNYM
jgi:hypothetical protein